MVRALLTLVLLMAAEAGAVVYQPPEQFVAEAFGGDPPSAQALWLDGDLKAALTGIFGHAPVMLRIRYWQRDERSVWILEEIGKEKPITTGVVVDEGAIADVRVLAFRESRGWEIRYPFFTDQFQARRLTQDSELDGAIDGITGATLSVRAMKKMARAALRLDRHARESRETSAAL
ncbi:MAG: FMN-binding protein [Pseudomonadales bacterium]